MNSETYLEIYQEHRRQDAKVLDEQAIRHIHELRNCPAFEKYFLRRLRSRYWIAIFN